MEIAKPPTDVGNGGTAMTWAQKVARGAQFKVPQNLQKKDRHGEDINYVKEIMFEDKNLRNHLRIHKAEQITQQVIEENSVLFEIQNKHFLTNREIYRLIETQIGKMEGATPYSRYGNTKNTTLLGITFKEAEDATKAMEDGIIIDEIKYLASPSYLNKSATPPKMVRVLLDHVPKQQETLLVGIMASMCMYGKICQVVKSTNDGIFEGQVSVLLDINDIDNDTKFQPLQRMLYLSYWDRYASAAYRGAPPYAINVENQVTLKKTVHFLLN